MRKMLSILLPVSMLINVNAACFAGINPITIVYNSGNPTFATSSSGSANYVVSLNPAVTPKGAALDFRLSNTGASSALIAQQRLTGASACTGVDTLCGSTFSLRAGDSCCLSFLLTSMTPGDFSLQPTVSTIPSTYSGQAPSQQPISVVTHTTPILSVSQTQLALSIQGTTSTGESTGKSRRIVVSNTGDGPVTGLNITEPAWPTGTQMSTTCGSTLSPGNHCNITITPGTAASSDCTTGTLPTPSVMTLSANDVTPIDIGVLILGYGCIHQEGYLFSIDDQTPDSQSIGGTVAALTNQSDGIIWSSNGHSSDANAVSYDMIPGIGNTSTASSGTPTFAEFSIYFNLIYTGTLGLSSGDFRACNGKTDGRCNTENIVTFYNYYRTNYDINSAPPYTPRVASTSKSYYAAGICDDYNSGQYQDWYLPAICELTIDEPIFRPETPGCGSEENPLMQNIVQNLFLNGVGQFTVGANFWSSAEFMYNNPEIYAWNVLIWVPSFPGGGDKNDLAKVRCVRALQG